MKIIIICSILSLYNILIIGLTHDYYVLDEKVMRLMDQVQSLINEKGIKK